MKWLQKSKPIKLLSVLVLCLVAVFSMTACGQTNNNQPEAGNEGQGSKLSGSIEIDGSSTVYPITEAVAEEFMTKNPNVMVTVGVSGTGGGFKRFIKGETDINDASRPIKDSEAQEAKDNGIEYVPMTVAYDGITVVVNKDNNWVDKLTVEELKKIWEPGSSVKKWSDIRSNWPDEEIKLYGPGTDSGTFDYFTEEICGEEGASRSDYMASEDDNQLVQGVAGDKYALGYFGYAYYSENTDKLKAVAIDNGEGAIEPTMETINNGSYVPLSRPIFIYVSKKSLKRPEVKEFVKFYMENASRLSREVGYVNAPNSVYQENLSKIN
ncbi:MAG: phosphate transport system substrate-binding protein [Clostridia bacterium]|nr:phosphate transport system substrate-binding protein [Clostridia bacterium]